MSAQQTYYALLIEKLPAPFNGLPWKTEGFYPFVKDAVSKQYAEDGDLEKPYGDSIIPDAWCIDGEFVFALEIVESNDIDDEKARRLADVFWSLDYAGYQFNVLLFYPKQQTLFVVWPGTLDARAEDLKERKFPYRDAFKTLMQRAA